MALVPFKGSAQPAPYDEPDDDDAEESAEDAGGKMSFLEHLDELRRRLVVAIIAVAVGFLIALFFIDRIFAFVMRPLQQILPHGGKLIYTEPTEAFMLQLKVAALAGLVLAAPAAETWWRADALMVVSLLPVTLGWVPATTRLRMGCSRSGRPGSAHMGGRWWFSWEPECSWWCSVRC